MATKRHGAILIGVVFVAVLGACAQPPAGPDPGPAASADLAVTQTIDNTTPNYWAPVELTTTVENLGADTATGVSVSVALPAGLTYLGSSGGYTPGTSTWTIGDLLAGDHATLTITARAGDVLLGNQTVTATASSATTDPNATNDTASVTEHSRRAPFDVNFVPHPGNPVDHPDISSGGTIGWTASVTTAIPGAPAPNIYISWFCSTESLIPCPDADGLILPNQQSLTLVLADLQVDIYRIELRATPGDSNYQEEFVQKELLFTTVNSGGGF